MSINTSYNIIQTQIKVKKYYHYNEFYDFIYYVSSVYFGDSRPLDLSFIDIINYSPYTELN